MLKNSSFNDSKPSSVPPATGSFMQCSFSPVSSTLTMACNITSLLLILPICLLIIQYGVRDWQRKRSNSSTVETSNIDCFTYHMVTMELIGLIGLVAMPFGILTKDHKILDVGFFFGSFAWHGEMFFNMLTCVERYLAVIHPITYLSLRNRKSVRIRDISIGCVWLLSFVGMVLGLKDVILVVVDLCLIIFFLGVTCFCSLSVLYALARPGPGQRCEGKERIGGAKLRSFHTIVAILGLLVLRFFSGLVWSSVYVEERRTCLLRAVAYWLNLPCSLLLPLLFLQRKRIIFARKTAPIEKQAQRKV